MPSKPAIIRQSDVTRILKGAAAAGVTYRIDVIDGKAHFVPVDGQAAPEAPSALERFRVRRNASKARGHS
jgi:hypothetical protein